eukprot:5125358-Amphidinium_carterae.1
MRKCGVSARERIVTENCSAHAISACKCLPYTMSCHLENTVLARDTQARYGTASQAWGQTRHGMSSILIISRDICDVELTKLNSVTVPTTSLHN